MIYLVLERHWVLSGCGEDVQPGDPRRDVRPNEYNPEVIELVQYTINPNTLGRPIRGFRDRDRAEAYRLEQQRERQAWTNPFRYGSRMSDRTRLDDGRLRDWMLDGGLNPPSPTAEEKIEVIARCWNKWWLKLRPSLTDSACEAMSREISQTLDRAAPASGKAAQLAWLDALFCYMENTTRKERDAIRIALYQVLCWDQPRHHGERDEQKISDLWIAWWDDQSKTMTELERRHAWEAMDELEFYLLVERGSNS
ncbi:MAG: hypothetical protein U0840_22765 [Gemmataceae bacterium]